ncbi:LysR family transcriptional regulator [Ochrovirga pacifica]|uniref:LysR family transcriptional regulator n=1 Tax=Ochrovirga pacifica TaxID=1042376 RepID=UPI0002558AF4|nr:LysR family transcriptional regulator [Ochrovirga pacifica]
MINLEWYRTFVAVYDHKTLTKAAAYLYASQPGVSVHLNALESYVGKKLFERSSRGMLPTEDGKQLYNYISDALKKLEKAEHHFKKTSKDAVPSLNIGMCTETFQTILETEISQLDFDLVAKFGEHPFLLKDLENGILDLVITPKQHKNQHKTSSYQAFAKETIVLIAGNKTPLTTIYKLIENREISELENYLKRETWYSASNEMAHFNRFWHENFHKRPDFKPNYILPNISSIIRCLENNHGFAIVPDFLIQNSLKNGSIQQVWKGNKEVSNILYFATRKNVQHQKEIDFIKEIFRRKMGSSLKTN